MARTFGSGIGELSNNIFPNLDVTVFSVLFGHYSQMMSAPLYILTSPIDSQTYAAAIISYENDLQWCGGRASGGLTLSGGNTLICFVGRFLNDY